MGRSVRGRELYGCRYWNPADSSMVLASLIALFAATTLGFKWAMYNPFPREPGVSWRACLLNVSFVFGLFVLATILNATEYKLLAGAIAAYAAGEMTGKGYALYGIDNPANPSRPPPGRATIWEEVMLGHGVRRPGEGRPGRDLPGHLGLSARREDQRRPREHGEACGPGGRHRPAAGPVRPGVRRGVRRVVRHRAAPQGAVPGAGDVLPRERRVVRPGDALLVPLRMHRAPHRSVGLPAAGSTEAGRRGPGRRLNAATTVLRRSPW